MFYCGRDHQTLDWNEDHKAICSSVKKTKTKLTREIETLNNMPGDFAFPEKPFENAVGHFWGIIDTRTYMRARYAHIEAILKVSNRTAVQSALDHLLDMLRLNRGDNMGIRSLVPALFLRLDRDQECYDFLKWWYLSNNDETYDWGNTDLPYMDIRNANAFEPTDDFNMKWTDLSHASMLCLLKWRLLTDLKALDNATAVAGDKLPTELLDQVRSMMVSSATKNNTSLMRDIENGRDIGGHIDQIKLQVMKLFSAVQARNEHYWHGVVSPGGHLTARPPHYSHGDVAEMQLSLSQTYDAWLETPGALEWVNSNVA